MIVFRSEVTSESHKPQIFFNNREPGRIYHSDFDVEVQPEYADLVKELMGATKGNSGFVYFISESGRQFGMHDVFTKGFPVELKPSDQLLSIRGSKTAEFLLTLYNDRYLVISCKIPISPWFGLSVTTSRPTEVGRIKLTCPKGYYVHGWKDGYNGRLVMDGHAKEKEKQVDHAFFQSLSMVSGTQKDGHQNN